MILLDFYLSDLESQTGVKVWSVARGSLFDFECVYGSLRPLPPSPTPFFHPSTSSLQSMLWGSAVSSFIAQDVNP